MRKNLFLWQLTGLTFTAVLGTILHFLYGWTKNPIVATFSAVNESTWEHIKLAFFPMLFFAVIEYPFSKDSAADFWQIKCVGILLSVALIPILFYTLNGIFGKTPDWLNILLYFISITTAYYVETKLFQKDAILPLPTLWAVGILLVLSLAFIFCTFFPPHIPLFQDPITGKFGIVHF